MTYLTDKETYEADKMITKEEVEARTMNISQRIIELEKGCWKDIGGIPCGESSYMGENEDGITMWTKKFYCNICQAKLQLLKEIKEDVLKKINQEYGAGKEIDTLLDNLKQNLIGEEQEK